MTDQRPDPDALLRELKLKEETRTGKLKIFFGYAAGVGKTYAMLEAAHHAKEMGVDVVAGYIEPHVRPETLALLDGLEQLPNKEIPYKNITLREFDLDGALARKPQLIHQYELAHTNAAGSRHRKRYRISRSCCGQASASTPPSTCSTWRASMTWWPPSPALRWRSGCPTGSLTAPTRLR